MTVLAISSQVVAGHVGNSAAQPVLQMLGHEVWALPTALLSHHPGHGLPVRRVTPAADLHHMFESLMEGGWLDNVNAIMTGYFAEPEQVEAVASFLMQIKHRHPDVTILVDPIMGDQGSLYISEAVAHAVVRDLTPHATILTPNLFELARMTPVADNAGAADIEAAARSLGMPEVVVTSTPGGGADMIGTLAVCGDEAHRIENPRRKNVPNGVGDVAAGAYLGHRLNGRTMAEALTATVTLVDQLITLAGTTSSRDLPLAAGRNAIIGTDAR